MGVRPFHNEQDGFTTAGMAIALLLVFALLFGTFHAYFVGTRSGEIQYVADAAALAADEEVAQFMLVGQLIDAVLFSMSLLGLTVHAAAVVASFIPGGLSVASSLSQFGNKVFKLRDGFYQKAESGLNIYENILPALACYRAYEVIEANAAVSNIEYKGAALTLPLQGKTVELSDAEPIEQTAQQFEDTHEQNQSDAQEFEQCEKLMAQAKEEAWQADCGSTGICLQERAEHLAGLTGVENSRCSSADAWSFSMPLERAKAYYQKRLQMEKEQKISSRPELVSESIARQKFYAYALTEVSKGEVKVDQNGLEEPQLVTLPRNIKEVKQTSLYTDSCYPISVQNGTRYLHSWSGCPNCGEENVVGYDSVASIDVGDNCECPKCCFSITTLGRVPSASTSINNGFEYYYRKIVEAAQEYCEAKDGAQKAQNSINETLSTLSNEFQTAVSDYVSKRINLQPAGRYGCICFVYAPSSSYTYGKNFFETGNGVGARFAISGATLVPDTSSETNVIESACSNLFADVELQGVCAKVFFGSWSKLIGLYTSGTEGLKDAFLSATNLIGLEGTSFSNRAVSVMEDTMENIGLQPVDLKVYQAVLINTAEILERDDSELAKTILDIKNGYTELDIGLIQDVISAIKNSDYLSALSALKNGAIELGNLDWQQTGLGSGIDTVTYALPQGMFSFL